jgi:hypothetical protein
MFRTVTNFCAMLCIAHYIFQTNLISRQALNADKEQTLKHTLQDLHKRLGAKALGIGNFPDQAAYIQTGFAELDVVFGGGFPRGKITEIQGKPTSGLTALTLKTIAEAQQAGDVVIYIDMASTFDPDYAIRCGVKVGDMLLARPSTSTEAFDMLFDSVASSLPGMVIFNAAFGLSPKDYPQLAAVLKRLNPALSRSRCTILLLTQPRPAHSAIATMSVIRLLIELEDWLYEGRSVAGYRARVTILKHKSPLANQPMIPISIIIDNTTAGDGT